MSRKGLNIYKRKDGRWEARYIKSRNALGKPKYGYLYASSYREVRCDLQHTLQLQGKPSGSEERTRNSTFELVSMEWLDAFSINFKESTYIRYRTLIECYLMPSFQTVKIEKITKEMVRKLCKHLELHGKKDKTGLSPKTISDVLSVLRRILNYAGTLGIFVDSKVLDKGTDYRLHQGRNFVGRSSEMDVCILGDNTVSRSSHAIVVYDPRSNVYLAQPGSSKELFYVNDKLVLNPIELKAMDQLSIGDTKLMFVPLCSEKFHW